MSGDKTPKQEAIYRMVREMLVERLPELATKQQRPQRSQEEAPVRPYGPPKLTLIQGGLA